MAIFSLRTSHSRFSFVLWRLVFPGGSVSWTVMICFLLLWLKDFRQPTLLRVINSYKNCLCLQEFFCLGNFNKLTWGRATKYCARKLFSNCIPGLPSLPSKQANKTLGDLLRTTAQCLLDKTWYRCRLPFRSNILEKQNFMRPTSPSLCNIVMASSASQMQLSTESVKVPD